ncbi:hypothetical protein RA29_16815 [Tateyamaria sp. ANG-S1]|nr:hypothetical protein RA29_16815 [Tateyamaria sp. ANG-S1]
MLRAEEYAGYRNQPLIKIDFNRGVSNAERPNACLSIHAQEVDGSYYFSDAQSLILSKNTLEITDTVDDDLHRTQADDPNSDQTFSFRGESAVTDYTVQHLDFAQVTRNSPRCGIGKWN